VEHLRRVLYQTEEMERSAENKQRRQAEEKEVKGAHTVVHAC